MVVHTLYPKSCPIRLGFLLWLLTLEASDLLYVNGVQGDMVGWFVIGCGLLG